MTTVLINQMIVLMSEMISDPRVPDHYVEPATQLIEEAKESLATQSNSRIVKPDKSEARHRAS